MPERNHVGGPETDAPAREGRQHDKNGKEVGDVGFHEVAFGLTPDVERETLEENAADLVKLAEAQVAGIAETNPRLGATAYRQLLALHPESDRADEWRRIADGLEADSVK